MKQFASVLMLVVVLVAGTSAQTPLITQDGDTFGIFGSYSRLSVNSISANGLGGGLFFSKPGRWDIAFGMDHVEEPFDETVVAMQFTPFIPLGAEGSVPFFLGFPLGVSTGTRASSNVAIVGGLLPAVRLADGSGAKLALYGIGAATYTTRNSDNELGGSFGTGLDLLILTGGSTGIMLGGSVSYSTTSEITVIGFDIGLVFDIGSGSSDFEQFDAYSKR